MIGRPNNNNATAASSSEAQPKPVGDESENSEAIPTGDRAVVSQEEIKALGSDDGNFQDAKAVRERKQRSGKRDGAIKAGDGAKENWKLSDTSKAMTALRHPDKQTCAMVLCSDDRRAN
jgi:hypothetical protein